MKNTIFLAQSCNRRLCSKMENEKKKNIIPKPINKKSILELFLKTRKPKNEIMIALEIKICQMRIEKECSYYYHWTNF